MSEIKIQRFKNNEPVSFSDFVADEEPLQITVDGFPVAVVMRTPGHDLDLVQGFLLTEGFINSIDSISRIDIEERPNHAFIFLKDNVIFDPAKMSRNLFSASSCGICGKASIESIHQQHPPISTDFHLHKDVLLSFPEKLRNAQKAFAQTGGIHAAALFHPTGELLTLREDVGRHNAIDKVIGWAAQQEIDCEKVALQVSGRVSFEVMQKALAARISIVSAISAPSSLAVEFAEQSNQTLIGFLRPPDFNLYSGFNRITCSA